MGVGQEVPLLMVLAFSPREDANELTKNHRRGYPF
jgi:hypothetical protein